MSRKNNTAMTMGIQSTLFEIKEMLTKINDKLYFITPQQQGLGKGLGDFVDRLTGKKPEGQPLVNPEFGFGESKPVPEEPLVAAMLQVNTPPDDAKAKLPPGDNDEPLRNDRVDLPGRDDDFYSPRPEDQKAPEDPKVQKLEDQQEQVKAVVNVHAEELRKLQVQMAELQKLAAARPPAAKRDDEDV
jgi:hypothetical protein